MTSGGSPLRVNFVLPLLSRTPIGGFRVVYEYADYLARNGHRVTITYPRRRGADLGGAGDRVADALWPVKKRLLDRPLVPWHRSHPAVRHRLIGSLAALSVPDADATVATAWETAGPVAALPRSKGAKLYLIQHYETWSGDKADVDATWRLPLRKVVIARWLMEVGRGLGATDMHHVTNGLDLSRFRLTRPLEGRPMRVVTMNHAEPFKGVPDALAALELFHEARPDVPVAMFGTMARGPEIPDWVEYHRDPTQSFLVDGIYNAGSVYLGASLEEGWGLPPAEAMACGCAFVGTDIGGFREFARPGRNALLSPPGRPAALAADLVKLCDDPALRAELQRGARDTIADFTWDRAGAAFVACIEDAS